MSEYLLKNGMVIGPDGPATADVRITDGVVVEIGTDLEARGEEILDCAGAWVGPGFVDIHTHLREPGEEWKEDIESGSKAAAAGGYTAVVAMPNTDPPTDAGHLARYIVERGRQVGLVAVAPAGCISEGRAGAKMAHLDELWHAGVRIFTDDGDAVMDSGLTRRAMEYIAEFGGVFAQHAEDAGLVAGAHMHEGPVSSRLGMLGRPAIAEEIVIARDLALVRLTGARYHVLHVSTASAVRLIAQAKAEGLPVTAEVTPHHLALDHGDVIETDPAYKMNPPLRDAADVTALRAALVDGTVDAVATDHAPHAAHEKEVPFEEAPPGIIGLETAAAVVNTFVEMDPALFFERMSMAPARIAALPDQGMPIEVGNAANLVVFDPHATWTPDVPISRAENTPFTGRALTGRPRYTMYGGKPTWRDGKVQI